MSAGPLIAILIMFIAIMTGSMYGLTVLASKMVTRAIQDRLRALQQITEGRVPAAWLKPFQKRVAALRGRSAGDAQFAQLGGRIQRHCLNLLDEMTRYITKINFTDSEVTRGEIVGLLKAYQKAWPAKDWHAWIADVEGLDTPSATSENDV